MASRVGMLLDDFMDGLRLRELWIFLGWRDVQKHYRRTIIGPFWLTLSMGVMVAGLGVLYSQIFGLELAAYLPFLTLGFVVWNLIGNSINGACTVFIAAASPLRQLSLPYSVYIYQFAWAQLISFGHNAIIYLIVIAIFAVNPGWASLLVLPALALILLNIVFAAMILGPLCLRFRDIPMIVGSVTQVTFFLTPILWSAEQIPERAYFVWLNPFYHYIEIARQPLLGNLPDLSHWVICLGLTTVLGVVALVFMARFRTRIPYWA